MVEQTTTAGGREPRTQHEAAAELGLDFDGGNPFTRMFIAAHYWRVRAKYWRRAFLDAARKGELCKPPQEGA